MADSKERLGSKSGRTASPLHVFVAPTRAVDKIIHFVRHGEGTHNVTHNYHLEDEFDAFLTQEGKRQARQAGHVLKDHPIELVVASPLSRALQTAEGALAVYPAKPPVVVHEACREGMQFGKEPCNRRRPVKDILYAFPVVEDFHFHHHPEARHDHDSGWRGNETYEDLVQRAKAFLDFVAKRPETHIAVFSHSVFLHAMFSDAVVCERGIRTSHFHNGEVRTVGMIIGESDA